MVQSLVFPTPRKTTCPYCGVGCGVQVETHIHEDSSSSYLIKGDTDHPANRGRLCSKGSALADTLTSEGRLTQPVVNGKSCDWNTAIAHVSEQLSQTIEQYGRESVAFYVSGQLLTEDYYVVNKFTKGWLGTANIDTNSRLCMASSVVGHKRAFGSDTVPGCYDDLLSADLVILVGSNLAWCHPVVFQRILAEKKRRPQMSLVVIDPRKTITADAADLHLAIQPDSDVALFGGLLDYLITQGACDSAFIEQHVSGFTEASHDCARHSIDKVAAATGLKETQLHAFYELFCATDKTVSVYSQGVNQSSQGTDKVNAIINCHLATGRIGKPGMGPFSITGQPNAMGGREVGGLATMLACHMELNNPEHRETVQSFWQSPYIASETGYCAVDLFQAIADGQVKAVWIMGTNPVDSLPEADRVKAALQACPFVVVSDVCAETDTLQLADVKLPAQAWGEKNGTVTNSERCISRQRSLKAPIGQARPDWWAVAQVATGMGYGDAFAYQNAAQIFREYANLSGANNDNNRDFDISACASITDEHYDTLSPFFWPWKHGEAPTTPVRFFAQGNFYTPDNKARMVTASLLNKPLANADSIPAKQNHLYVLNTGRIRDQWHTMTRTGVSVRLAQHLAEPFVVLHPDDAQNNGIAMADIVRVSSPHGEVLLRALISDRQLPGQVFAPMHWTDQYASKARVGTLISAEVDPFSRQPASKTQKVSIESYPAYSYAYAVMRDKPEFPSQYENAYWAISPIDSGWQCELASLLPVRELHKLLLQTIQQSSKDADSAESFIESTDSKSQNIRMSVYRNERVHALIYLSSRPVVVSRSWARQQLDLSIKPPDRRWQLLAGTGAADQPDKGAIVCSCYSVGTTQIEQALLQGLCSDLKGIGEQLQAGTNCGSCRSEIQSILNQGHQTLKRKCTTSPSRSR